MDDSNQKQLGKTRWNIANQLRGAMNTQAFRDTMLAFLFLRYLSDNSEQAAKIQSLKQHKRGLMQQLFPALGEQ